MPSAIVITVTDPALSAILALLARKHPAETIMPTTDIWGNGLADSEMWLEIILEVEGMTGLQFNPDSMEFDGPMTPLKMAGAFRAQE